MEFSIRKIKTPLLYILDENRLNFISYILIIDVSSTTHLLEVLPEEDVMSLESGR